LNADGIRVGSMTPWGGADFVRHDAEGIVSVSTPSHGGIGLSPARNAEIDKAWRNANGWYEEDCEAYIVLVRFFDEFETFQLDDDQGRAALSRIHDSLHYWYPEVHARLYPREAADRQDEQTVRDWQREYEERRRAQAVGQ
jgi:hypothetical protein